jgi:hypothetical protein
MTQLKLILVAAATTLSLAWSDRANAAVTLFTDATAYFAAAGTQTLQDFNSPISTTTATSITSITYSDLVVSSNPLQTVTSPSITGLSVFGSGPAPITFTFNSPVTSFGIFIAGLGTIQPGSATLLVINSNGFFANAFVNYSSTNNDFSGGVFVGLISDKPFVSVTFIDSEIGDGIFFDNAYYSPAAPVFAGTPGQSNCFGQSVSALTNQHGGLSNAAAALGFDSVNALQGAIQEFCGG